MGRIKSLIVTVLIMALIWWVYELTDMYAWGAHQILEGVLVVAGMLAIGAAVYIFLRLSDSDLRLLSGKRKKQPWEVEWQTGQWQR